MNPKKVLFITDYFFNIAGAEKNLIDVSSGLNRSKFTSLVLVLQGGDAVGYFKERGIK